MTTRKSPGTPPHPHGGSVGCLLMQALPLRDAVDAFAGVVLRSLTTLPLTLAHLKMTARRDCGRYVFRSASSATSLSATGARSPVSSTRTPCFTVSP